MVKSPVKVAVRTRPTASFASQNIQIDLDKKTIDVHIPKDSSQGIINNQQEDWKFKFDEILHNSSQEAVYDSMARQLVQSVVQGYNGTVLAYGQTGAGKTYTMSGTANNYKYRGVIPRAVSQVFHEIQNKLEQAITFGSNPKCSKLIVSTESRKECASCNFFNISKVGSDAAIFDFIEIAPC